MNKTIIILLTFMIFTGCSSNSNAKQADTTPAATEWVAIDKLIYNYKE